MKNFDPYKRTILFVASFINVCLMTVLFVHVWYNYYQQTMYVIQFYRKGNYVIFMLYALLLFFFSNMYGNLKIGQLRRIEVMLSQYLSLFLTNAVIYIVISLLAFGFVSPYHLALMMVAEMVVSSLWNILVIKVYNRIFQPWKLLYIYGERPGVDLVYKLETRKDKYTIYDAIHIDEGLEAIGEKMENYQAVIIGDISAIKRNDVLKYCYARKKRAYVIPKISDIILMGTDRIHIFDTPFLLSRGYTLSADQRFVKRAMDIVLSLILLILSSPIMLCAMIAIKLDDGGEIFYRQVRCTRYEKNFTIYKFRSMVMDAEKDGEARLARENDERITRVGRFIRAARIDELPQLINILKGDMSFVGPRPERPEIMEEYCRTMPEFPFRNRVKAGLTGFAQIYGKYNTTPYDKLKLDLFYIANYSFWTDIKLILMTVKTLLRPDSTQGVEEDQITAERAATEIREGEVEAVVKEMRQTETAYTNDN
ncbi:MAG: exopolysaccharide biosynthesis polyprenyl glycosylphosphotransferase [Lachnospiraceae bacterium]|nr:exopolysaccharide biosynthesis polyprenyl glycosylphosphotransferase [Lachnospiraceae bacterium]